MPDIEVRTDGSVRTLVMARPQTRNALDLDMLRSIRAALEAAADDAAIHVIVLTGGDRVFASGADIAQLRDMSPSEYLTSERREAWDAIERFPKPMIAAVAGYALGGGCELALRCDAIVAGDGAILGQPEPQLGIVAGAGGAQWWTRVGGRFASAEVLLAGERVDAYEARRLGIVTAVVPDEAVVLAAKDLARRIASGGPLAVRLTKEMMRLAYEAPFSSAMVSDRGSLAVTLSTEDHVEGMNAVLERRPPVFEGR